MTDPDDPKPAAPKKPAEPPSGPEADPAAEWGERIDTGKTIERGGKAGGATPGAEPQ